MITQQRLMELTIYDPETGVFRWRVGPFKAGKIIGFNHSQGYRAAQIEGHRVFLHRFAWIYMTGEPPKNQIDHINGKRDDNRWANLREATQQQNSANMRKRDSNTSGMKGVYFSKNNRKWIANIHLDYKTRYLGSFSCKEEAHAAYMEASKLHHGEFARAL